MAPHDGEDDPAVYRSGSQAKNGSNGAPHTNGAENEHEDDDDSTLLAVHPGFNRLLLVLRDEGVMHFVKYVSAAAEGSRWDVCGEYEIGVLQMQDDADDGES
jgi:prolyl 3-hydroxylase /prolyl 3,4-dihydroxylase